MRRPAFLFLFLMSICSGLRAQEQKLTLQSINIFGNDKTRRSVILRELPVREGQQILADSLSTCLEIARLRLLNVGLFTTVAVRSDSVGDHALKWDILLQERWSIIPSPIFRLADRNFNVWWDEMNHDLRRINVGVRVRDNNFRGNLESLSFTVQAGYTQQLAVEYLRPYIDDQQHHGIGGYASASQSAELAYATNNNKQLFARMPGNHIIRQYDLGLVWFYRPDFAVRHSVSLGAHRIDVSDTVYELNIDYLGEGRDHLNYLDLNYRIDYNGVDNWNYPLVGFKSVSQATLRKGIDDDFWQAQVRTETGLFVPLKSKFYSSLIFRGRLSAPGYVPYYFRSALGTKTDYVRGYEYYVVDGSHYGLLRFDLKYQLFNHVFRKFGFHYLPELPIRIYPKLFADAGYGHNADPGNSTLYDRWLYSAGAGVDIVSAYDFKIRIEAAVNHLGEWGIYLHFNSE
jgi:outer membrane protein assembly factor BamA